MSGDEVTFELGSLGEVRGKLTLDAVLDIEKNVGAIAAIVFRMGTMQASLSEVAAVLHRFIVEAMDDAAPSLREVRRAVLGVGISPACDLATPFLKRVMEGDSTTSEPDDSD